MILLCFITGVLGGISMALGFRPVFKQPKNFRIQIFFFTVAIIGLLLIFNHYKN